MTKQNPEKLCPSCELFDYNMNRKGSVSMDFYVVCECDESKDSNQKLENTSAKLEIENE